jgi:hypothetical protein
MDLKKEKLYAKVKKVEYIDSIQKETGLPEEFANLAYKIIVHGGDSSKSKNKTGKRIQNIIRQE